MAVPCVFSASEVPKGKSPTHIFCTPEDCSRWLRQDENRRRVKPNTEILLFSGTEINVRGIGDLALEIDWPITTLSFLFSCVYQDLHRDSLLPDLSRALLSRNSFGDSRRNRQFEEFVLIRLYHEKYPEHEAYQAD